VVKYGKRFIFPLYIPLISNFVNKYIAHLPFIEKFCLIEYIVARPVDRENMEKYSVSIVIPARNEKGNIKRALDLTPVMGKFTEIIFVEGNSTDETWSEIKKQCKEYRGQCRLKFMQQEGKGKGDAVRKGFANASGDILMILDADLTVPPQELPKFYGAIANNKGEFINGCRLIYPMDKQAMRFLNLLGNHFFANMFTWLLGQNIKDTLCGTKVLWKKDYETIVANRKFFGDFDPFGDFDLIFGASKLALKIIDLPIRYKERTYGTTNISRFKHGLILLRMCGFAARKIKFV